MSAAGSPLLGVYIKIEHRTCRCGADLTAVCAGSGPHAAALRCIGCDEHAGWLSRPTFQGIEKVVTTFGKSKDAIVIRRGGVR
jgi:hypothetical protein